MSSLLMNAIRRSGAWHFRQTISNPQLTHQYANRLTDTFITRPSASMTESALEPP